MSIAKGQGSDIAMDGKGDLVSSDPSLLAKAFKLSHDTVQEFVKTFLGVL